MPRKRSEALEARARATSAAADQTRDQIAALAARIQQAEADLRAGEARIAIIADKQRVQARRLAERQQPIVRLTAALQQIARRAAGSRAGRARLGQRHGPSRAIVLAQVDAARDRTARAICAPRSPAAPRCAQAPRPRRRRSPAAASGLAAQQRSARRAGAAPARRHARRSRHSASLEIERALALGEEARDIGELMARIEDAAVVREALLALPGPVPRPAAPGNRAAPGRPRCAPWTRSAAPIACRSIGEVVTGFGEVSESGVRARGLTLATAPGATVVAPARGRIAFAGPFRGYGQIVIIDHGGGWTTPDRATRPAERASRRRCRASGRSARRRPAGTIRASRSSCAGRSGRSTSPPLLR